MNINHIHNAYARIPKIIQKFKNVKLQNHFENVSYLCHNIRKYTQQSIPSTYSHWQINEYGNTDKLSLINDVPIPIVRNRNEVLIKVHASSVNPIDTRMLHGYGNEIMSRMRYVNGKCTNHSIKTFPLILGRDFSGTIAHTSGHTSSASSSHRYRVGDQVFGALHPFNSGAHAEYILANTDEFTHKPEKLTHEEAASLPYVVMTTHAALWGLDKHSFTGKRVLILGASGGIGTYATQILSLWGGNVIAVCSEDSHSMMKQLGALQCRDYHRDDYDKDLQHSCDFILDAVDRTSAGLQFDWTSLLAPGGRYITLDTPVLKETDDKGLFCGLITSGIQLGNKLSKGLSKGQLYSWGFFKTNKESLSTAKTLIDDGNIIPVIDIVYKYKDLPEAYEAVIKGHRRGKTVISIVE